jgi:hypothetical protein
VLQNKKYIAFADDNSVDVLTMDRLQEGIDKKDKRAGTYKRKDVDGQEKEFLLSWPSLTIEELKAMDGTKASSYNTTRKLPYTAVVDPYTLEEMGNLPGGFAVGTLTDLVAAKKKELEKAHGKGTSRKTLAKVRESDAAIRKELEAGNLAKALADSHALQKKVAKESDALIEIAGKTAADVLAAAGTKLDEIEAMIGRGEKAEAAKALGPLSKGLKGTTLEERAMALLEQTK